MKNAHFYVFNVGHGVCTLLTGEKSMEGESNSYCAVFDCGSMAYNPDWKKEDVVTKMTEIILPLGQIDDLIISHQDEDHRSMLLDLFLKLNNFLQLDKDRKSILFGVAKEYVWKYMESEFRVYTKNPEGQPYADYIFSSMKNNTGLDNFIHFYIVSWDSKESYDNDKKATYSWNKIEIKFFNHEKEYSVRMERDANCVFRAFFSFDRESKPGMSRLHSESNELYDDFPKFEQMVWGRLKDKFGNLLAGEFKRHLDNIIQKIQDGTIKKEIDSNLQKTDKDVKPIAFFIKRIVFGGDRASLEYSYLISFFESIQRCYEMTQGTQIFIAQAGGYLKLKDNETFNRIQEKNIQRLGTNKDILNNRGQATINDLNIIRNTSSVITEFVVDENSSILLPGDVTVHKFDYLTQKLKKPSTIRYFLAPHHGSDHTNFAYKTVGSEVVSVEYKDQPLAKLLDTIGDCIIIVSAYHSNRPHPGCHFIELAKNKSLTLDCDKEHYIVYTYDNNKQHLKRESIKKALYTTNRLISTKENPVEDPDAPPKSQEPYLEFTVPSVTPVSSPAPPVSTISTESHSLLRIPPDDCFI